MLELFKKDGIKDEEFVMTRTGGSSTSINDDEDLAKMGYKSEFKREFTNLGTISFAFSIMYVLTSGYQRHSRAGTLMSSLCALRDAGESHHP